ncbi:MAG TPA: D-cysteine desulfhydrase family protein [Candidatus Limnocylindrales bacterium]|nr:D-cysteine desulfhydrase family protein [Candidatus Limnocylindrales bacterium]
MVLPPAIAALPRFPLLDGPSPLGRLDRFSDALGGGADIWIKREDLLPLAFGGNKLRNLEFLVGAALADGADTLVTSGRRWSNHCRLTAAAGAKAGLDVHLVLTGPPLAPGTEGANQVLDALLGATIHVTPNEDRAERAALVETVAAGLRERGRRPFVIGVGGSGPIGAAGQVLAGLELAEQLASHGIGTSTVIVPSATGGTQAGLLSGLALAAPPAHRVAGIAVATPSAELRPTIEALLDGLAPLTGSHVASNAVDLTDDQMGDGYGRPTDAAREAMELLARTEGILVDPIYTAKALAGLIARVRDGRLSGPAVFWHAGGTPGLFEPQ